ncbi:MAG: hypothetical protein WBM69_26505 [Desulfobacterales bacterium]
MGTLKITGTATFYLTRIEIAYADVEKDFMLDLLRRYAALYFVEVLGFCLMGNHFHILVRMFPKYKFSDEDIQKRYENFYGD